MNILLVFLAIIATTFAAPLLELKQEKNRFSAIFAEMGGLQKMARGSERIIGGNATTIESFPWIVSIQAFGQHSCGGSIISVNRILTAAHCTANVPLSAIQVRAGSTNNEIDGQLIQVTGIINHQEYDSWTLNNDISVMWIASSLNLTQPGFAIIPMPDQGSGVATGGIAQVAGWGGTCFGCPDINLLRFVSVPIISNTQCNALWYDIIYDGMLCTTFAESGSNVCDGDSGGPLTLGGLLVGVVTWNEGCGYPTLPSIYTRVAFYRDWINSAI